jgi:acyl-CoA reductase-like NAD-dependent aldehyde dehydrogenase
MRDIPGKSSDRTRRELQVGLAQNKRRHKLIRAGLAGGPAQAYRFLARNERIRGCGSFLPIAIIGYSFKYPLVIDEQFGPALPLQEYEKAKAALPWTNAQESALTRSARFENTAPQIVMAWKAAATV